MKEPDLKVLQAMVQRVLDEQTALREFAEVQFAVIRIRDRISAAAAKSRARS